MTELNGGLTLQDPWFLLWGAILPLTFFVLKRLSTRRSGSLRLPEASVIIRGPMSWRVQVMPFLSVFFWLAWACFTLALARPQEALQEVRVRAAGIDILIALDLSGSMLAQDFKPNRLAVCKRVAMRFIDKRKHDRIGLVSFAGEAFSVCPLTADHNILKAYLRGLQCGMLEDGTAIGMGLGTAINRIRDSEAKSKVVILLTDGVNNAGYLKPLSAAALARQFGTKVYTIGVGTSGAALTPVSRREDGAYIFGLAQVTIDENLLQAIAQTTGGKYYRATNESTLEKIYSQIDLLEKTRMEVTRFLRFRDLFPWFVGVGLLLLILERVLRATLFLTIP